VEGSTEHRELSEGTMLDDKYRIERLLASGGMGAVYLGTHTKLRKRVAIKILNPELSSAPMVERFHREAITASQIGHEGIAQVTDIGTSREGEPFLVMEYLEGEPLASRLRASGPLAVEDACEFGCAILSPLAAAHRAGIVHRDLKPDNVFLVRQSRGEMVKLLDFGISRAQGLGSEFRLTKTGLVLGTPYYMSPEQARGDSEINPAADLYAFGVILYEMLIGSVPIEADNYNQLMYRVMIGDFARPREQRPDLPEALEQIILHAMAQAPENRPASAAELEQALLPFCRPAFREHTSGRMSMPGIPLPTPLPSPARRPSTGLGHTDIASDHTLVASSQVSAPAVRDRATTSPVATTSGDHPVTVTLLRRSRVPWIAGAIVVFAGIAGAVIALGGDDTPGEVVPPAPPAALPVAHTAADAASAPPPAPDAPPETPGARPATDPTGESPAVPAATITLQFAVKPAGAAIVLDGAQIRATELVVPRDDAPHTLRITASGYAGHDQTIRFDESQRLTVQLKRAPRSGRGTGSGRGNDRHKRNPDIIESESPYQ
jgi:serine/threonine-protein kinase